MGASYPNGIGERGDFLRQLDKYLKGRVDGKDYDKINFETLSQEASEHFQRGITPETVRWRLRI